MTIGYRNYILSNNSISNTYINAPNYGPYNSRQYPSIVSNLNNGTLSGVKPSPAEFSIMDTGNDYSSARQTYTRVFHPLNTPFARQIAKRPIQYGCRLKQPARRFKGGLSSIGYVHSNSKNYIPPTTGGENTYMKKVANIGKSSLKQGLPDTAYFSNKCYDKTFVTTKLKRARSSGCIPPKKCSSVYNHQFTPVNSFTQSSYF
jgi:hypothetical protein